MEDQPGLRKGTWSREEDNILRQCIAEHGEGKWHQIPAAAGLNRCRKGCRLRWLNYLKPNIKRGEFEEDEVDLILKLHKLLGNRWSLIAGRLPGRTTNDVKNFWNMKQRQEKTEKPRRLSNTKQKSQEIVKPITLRPKPQRLLSTSSRCFTGEGLTSDPIQLEKNISTALPTSSASPIQKEIDWVKVFLEEEVEERMQTTTCSSLPIKGLFTEDHIQSGNSIRCRTLPTPTAVEDQLDWWKTFLDQ